MVGSARFPILSSIFVLIQLRLHRILRKLAYLQKLPLGYLFLGAMAGVSCLLLTYEAKLLGR